MESTVTNERLLQVRTVEVVSGRGRSITLSSVRCPVHGRTAAADECAHCGDGGGMAEDALARGEYLACRARAAPARGGATAAERALVGEVMRRTAVALRPGVGRSAAAAALRARGVAAAPVVDGEGRPVGFVAESDLLRARTGARVADAMRRVALSVPAVAPLSRVAALMASRRADRVCVVSEDGAVVGVLTALDLVAWLAGQGGPLAAADAPPDRDA